MKIKNKLVYMYSVLSGGGGSISLTNFYVNKGGCLRRGN